MFSGKRAILEQRDCNSEGPCGRTVQNYAGADG